MLRSSSVSSHEACHPLKQLADGMHPHRHGNTLHVAGNTGQLGQITREPGTVQTGHIRIVANHRLRDDEFAHHVDQSVELAGVDFDRSRCTRRFLIDGGRGWRRRFRYSHCQLRQIVSGLDRRKRLSHISNARD